MRGDFFDIVALLGHRLHGAELVERMKGFAPGIFGEAVVFGKDAAIGRLDDARNGSIPGEPLLLHQQLKSAISPASGRNLIIPGFLAVVIQDRPDIEAGQQASPLDIGCEFSNSFPGEDFPHVGLGQKQPVEGNVARLVEGDFRLRLGHEPSPGRDAGSHSPDSRFRRKDRNSLWLSKRHRQVRRSGRIRQGTGRMAFDRFPEAPRGSAVNSVQARAAENFTSS
ncbi:MULTISPECIES: hypothetical protein [unclassified Sphingopyxis]|uniref:hypothetical protein n=1 Tax=unclassified Sphingopyxis TaxID=2614943 RepID=UPI003FA796D9